jgi:hypothetical protein
LKKTLLVAALMLGIVNAPKAKAQFSTDAPILLEILANNISQLYQLYEMVRTAQDNLRMMRDLSQGLDTALNLYNSLNPPTDPGQYRNWQNVGNALTQLRSLYGQVAATKEAAVQQDIDQGVAEAISLNNKVYDYTLKSDRIGQQIQSRSNSTNTKGAQRLTAQSIGVLIEAQNQATRTQATQLKLSAQALALENRKDKEYARRISEDTGTLSAALKSSRTSFSTPRF